MGAKVTQNDIYAARIFFNSAIPLLKVIAADRPAIGSRFAGRSFVFQISAKYDPRSEAAEDARHFTPEFLGLAGGRMGTHLICENGAFTVRPGEIHADPDIELCFGDLHKFIDFFAGRGTPLPAMHGVLGHPGIFMVLLKGLLLMAKLLGAKEAPADPEDRRLTVKLYFYLLVNGISQLNKAGHEAIHRWALESPDRAYALAVTGFDDLQAYIRVMAGNSKAGRGAYPRCRPFLTLRFDSPGHALDILMGKGDMLDFVKRGYLTIEGAPEFGAVIGDYMFVVGDYAKGLYLDRREDDGRR